MVHTGEHTGEHRCRQSRVGEMDEDNLRMRGEVSTPLVHFHTRIATPLKSVNLNLSTWNFTLDFTLDFNLFKFLENLEYASYPP